MSWGQENNFDQPSRPDSPLIRPDSPTGSTDSTETITPSSSSSSITSKGKASNLIIGRRNR